MVIIHRGIHRMKVNAIVRLVLHLILGQFHHGTTLQHSIVIKIMSTTHLHPTVLLHYLIEQVTFLMVNQIIMKINRHHLDTIEHPIIVSHIYRS